MNFTDASLQFFDWEDRILTFSRANFQICEVRRDLSLVPVDPGVLLSDLMHNATPLTKKRAKARAKAQDRRIRSDIV